MGFLTLFFYLRKISVIFQITISSLLTFFIIINAETWAFCQKYNGDDARLIVFPITIAGIITGILAWKYMKKMDIFVVLWYVIYAIWVIGNRICVST